MHAQSGRFRGAVLAALALVSFVAVHAHAASFVVPPDSAMVQRADAIVAGTVLSSYPQFNSGGGVETVTVVSVEQVLKGNGIGETITVVEPGGAIDGHATIIPGVPQFTAGQHVLLLLSRTPEQRWAVSDLILGKFDFTVDHSGRRMLVRDASLDGDRPRPAGEFLQFIRRESTGSGIPLASAKLVKAETSVRVTQIGQYSLSSYTTNINHGGSSDGAFWATEIVGGGYVVITWYRGAQGEPGAANGGDDAINAAIAAWTDDCASIERHAYGGVDSGNHTGGLAQPDGANTFLFERDLSSYGIAPFSCSTGGVLGIGGITAVDDTAPHISIWVAKEADVEMNSGIANCSQLFTSGDFASAIAHQFGHALGIRHADRTRDDTDSCVSDPLLDCGTGRAIMSSVFTPGIRAILQPWDQHAVAALPYWSTCPRVPGDFNRDSRPDLLWRNSATGDLNVWLLNGTRYLWGTKLGTMDPCWAVIDVADLAYDPTAYDSSAFRGWSDVVWESAPDPYACGSSDHPVWIMDGTDYSFTSNLGGWISQHTNATWKVDAPMHQAWGSVQDNLLLRNYTTGEIHIAYIIDGRVQGEDPITPSVADPNWHIEGAGDFDHDGMMDIVWRNYATGDVNVWFMSYRRPPLFISGTTMGNAKDPAWKIVAISDYNGDGSPDLLWQHQTTGDVNVWFMNGPKYGSGTTIFKMPDPNWRIVGPK